jgi:class 3 adenylate cyclase/tetratricopeptide (TPR) repeat protein
MNCLKCQTENLETRKFCKKCGTKLLIICSQCSSENLPDDFFCGECGHSLSAAAPSKPTPKDLTFDEKLAKIQKYLPGNITEKILSQRERIEGERKQVTVMFVDTAGYASISEKLDAEEVYSLMDKVYELLIHKVNEYGGTVNEFTGDGIMALFGAPIALEDAPQRAIRAGLAIHREIVQFNERLRMEKPRLPQLHLRAGIHTGPVVVGTIGNDLRVSFTAMGDTVNLASRMEGLAEPGTTYVTTETFKLTEGYFRFECMGKKAVKGKMAPVEVYRVIAPSSRRTRFDVSAERGLTPFVGRERERELLLDAFERARSGRGQAVSIISEAGMGKSRLLYEFRKAILNEDVTFLEGKCLSFGRGITYQPITDILKSNFDIREDDGDPIIRNKVSLGLQAIFLEEGPALPYILELISVRNSGLDQIQLSPEGKKERTIETLKKIVLKGAEIRPLIVAIEDLHWIDKTSEEALKYLLEAIPGARILLIFTYRPEFIPTWGARSYHNQVLINRLSNREVLFMAEHILGTEQIPPGPPLKKGGIEQPGGTNYPPLVKGGGGDFRTGIMESALEETILEKTEGVPFFVEEFIKSLKDLGFIERKDAAYRIAKELQAARIPSTIQDIIMARVDTLPEGTKELLQVGSLIGREFGYSLIKNVMNLSEGELLHRLSILKEAELLYERGVFPDSTYIFKHALTMEVVYGTLLERKKKELHRDIGKAIEKVYEEKLEEMYIPLAEHFSESGDYKRAAEYYRWAARKVLRASDRVEAIALTRQRVAMLEKLPLTVEVQKRAIDARVTLANICQNINRYAEARETLVPIMELVHRLDYREKLSAIYVAMAIYLLMVEEKIDQETLHLIREAQKLARAEHDSLSLWWACYYEAAYQISRCAFEDGEASLFQILKMSETAGVVVGKGVAMFNIATFIYIHDGRIDLAMKVSQQVLKLAIDNDDPLLKAGSYMACGLSFFTKGLFSEAEENLRLAIEWGQKADFVGALFSDFLYLGLIRFEDGRYHEAQECCDNLLALHDRINLWPSMARLAKLLKVAAGIKGHLNPGGNSVDEFELQEIRIKPLETGAALVMADIYLHRNKGRMDKAESWIKRAVETSEQNRMPWDLARAYALYGEFFQKKGDPTQAREKLNKAIDLMRSIGADGWVKRYEEDLAAF